MALLHHTQMAGLVGCAIGLLILVVLRKFPGEPFAYELDDDNGDASKDSLPDCPRRGPHAERLVIDPDRLEAKSRKAEELFGIPHAAFKEAVESATAEHNARAGTEDPLPGLDLISLAPIAAIVIGALLYASTPIRSVCAPYLHTLARAFPREARALGYST